MVTISNIKPNFYETLKINFIVFFVLLFVSLANSQTVTKTERNVEKFFDLIKIISKKSFDEKFLIDIFHKKYVRLGVTTSIPSGAATQRYNQPRINGELI